MMTSHSYPVPTLDRGRISIQSGLRNRRPENLYTASEDQYRKESVGELPQKHRVAGSVSTPLTRILSFA